MTEHAYESQFFQLLKEELVPALGCTEPIAIAFGAAKAREVLGRFPERIDVCCSCNLIKNIRCVTVPNTGQLVGIEAAVVAGIVGGKSGKGMEVLADLDDQDRSRIRDIINQNICTIRLLESPLNLHFIITCHAGGSYSKIEIKNLHTNITLIEKDGHVLFSANEAATGYYGVLTDRSFMTVDRILSFVEQADLNQLKEVLSKQIEYNMAIAHAGMTETFGVGIGRTILKHDSSLFGKIKAYSSAASEARMCGSLLPVITNSGSGNQGITASVPVIIFAKEKKLPEAKMYRAIALANLLSIYQKSLIGRLSAFCGAISASCGSGAAITYLDGGTPEQVKMAVINTLANASGIVCDGAKASCAAKIAAGLDAAMLGYFLAIENQVYLPRSGILGDNADQTISAIGRIAREGMKDMDRVILDIMLDSETTEKCID